MLLAKSSALSANDIFICPVLNENSLLLGIIKNPVAEPKSSVYTGSPYVCPNDFTYISERGILLI